ncbi:hypothetical protein MRB53_037671 [Persea americana]|nr:hypothetical protein MRB53_037671 [Persea americana]
MDDDTLAQFTAITSATPERAQQYLRLTENNLEQAVQLFFESGGVDMGGDFNAADAPSQRPSAPRSGSGTAHDAIEIDSDEDEGMGAHVADDEAMARRLQEEMYGSGGAGADADVRAPMARQMETLVGPDADWRDDPSSLDAAVHEQLLARQRRESIWDEESADPSTRRRGLARATGGASEASSKASHLAELFRPPFELISPLRTWEAVRAEGKEEEKWILINVQDPNIFDCQVLNRDIWKNKEIQATVRESFIFKQYTKADPQASNYVRYYFQAVDSQDAYPHIGIVDPRTGEQVKVWSGAPAPKPEEFLSQLHEFLDRYSLQANSRNPVAKRKPEKKEKEVGKMTEEEMLEMALQASMSNGHAGPREEDPDILTRSGILDPNGKGKDHEHNDVDMADDEVMPAKNSAFSRISSFSPHTEPPASNEATRVQVRHPHGRVIRRFLLSDPVRTIYEWLKAEPDVLGDDAAGKEFDIIYMGKNLIERLDESIEQAGLKNGSLMVEFVGNDGA